MSVDNQDIIAADPRLRRFALLMVLAGVIVGAMLLQWGLPALSGMAATGQIRKRWICLGFLGVLILLVGPVVFVGFQIRARARQIITAEQFPWPNARLMMPAKVLRGAQAVAIGKLQIVLGTALIVLATALFALSSYAAVILLLR